jgi:hypothetical protein
VPRQHSGRTLEPLSNDRGFKARHWQRLLLCLAQKYLTKLKILALDTNTLAYFAALIQQNYFLSYKHTSLLCCLARKYPTKLKILA